MLSPVAKAITCLESTHSTVADVFLFWLAVNAAFHHLLSQGGLSVSDSEKIRRVVNRRFNQMVNEAPCDVYITGFVLDPSESFLLKSTYSKSTTDYFDRVSKCPHYARPQSARGP